MSMISRWVGRRFTLPIVVACALSVSTIPAQAAFITYSFTGTTDDFSPLDVTGSFQFNNATGGSGGVYHNAVTGFTITIGGYTSSFAPGINGIEISQNSSLGLGITGDRWALASRATGDELTGTLPYSFDIRFDRQGGGLLSDTALQNPPSFGSLSDARWRLYFEDAQGTPFAAIGSVDSLTAVPLPPAVLLFGAGLVALVGLGVGGLRNLRESQS